LREVFVEAGAAHVILVCLSYAKGQLNLYSEDTTGARDVADGEALPREVVNALPP